MPTSRGSTSPFLSGKKSPAQSRKKAEERNRNLCGKTDGIDRFGAGQRDSNLRFYSLSMNSEAFGAFSGLLGDSAVLQKAHEAQARRRQGLRESWPGWVASR
jgi:hypothetical protein